MINRQIKKWFVLCVSLAFSSLVSAADINLTEEEISYLSGINEIRKCVDPMWMPFEAIDEKGKHIGIIADITEIMAREIGVPITLVHTRNWIESHQLLEEGRCDIVTSDAIIGTNITDSYFKNTDPFLQYKGAFITQKTTELALNFEAISDQKIGFVKGYPTLVLAKEKFPNMQTIEVDAVDDGVLKVSTGELYAFVELLPTISYSAQKQGLTNLKIAGHVDIDIPIVMSLRTDQPELLQIINKSLASISNETKNRLFNNWVSVDYVTKIDYYFILRGLILIFVVVMISLYWINKNRALRQEILAAKERERLMRDIHDGVGGHLVSTIALLDSQQSSTAQVRQSLMDCLADLRVVILSLDPSSSELAILLGMFRHNIQPKVKAAGITLAWHVGDIESLPKLSTKSALNILRILQESVTNVIKHSGASRLSISTNLTPITKSSYAIAISVMDDGSGKFDDDKAGYGVKNMKKRASELGGNLAIDASEKGTKVMLNFTL